MKKKSRILRTRVIETHVFLQVIYEPLYQIKVLLQRPSAGSKRPPVSHLKALKQPSPSPPPLISPSLLAQGFKIVPMPWAKYKRFNTFLQLGRTLSKSPGINKSKSQVAGRRGGGGGGEEEEGR